ncbi:MAG: amidohydrolase family protein [Holophagales bacterium]|jgi:imidazolonepropionase-like amidohydrolase|nr:amidohydrolase family protein [Holophagales bacterium]MBK9963411.1 amidohydrolase family protein [Holophagales bacterium]
MRSHVRIPATLVTSVTLAVLCAVLAAPLALAEPPARLLVHAGRLVDGVSAAREMVTVIVEGDRIAEVVAGFRVPAPGEKVLDLSDATVLPGFIDLHVHLGMEMSPEAYLDQFTQNPTDVALRAVVHARTTLRAGFTTVRNLGDGYGVTISLRDAIRRGWVEGPRIFTAGKAIGTTGSHADPTNGWCDLIEGDPGPKDGVANGADEMRKAVRQRYKERADLIKITATGGVLSLARSPNAPQFTQDEVDAVVKTARDYDLPVAVHAHGAEGMKRALRAGVDSIEHGTQMDDEAIQLFKEKGSWYVPTLSAGVFVGQKAKLDGYFPEVVRPKAALVGAQIRATAAKAVQSGVRVAFGTDAGVFPHGENGKEFGYLVEAGMTPMAAIQAATFQAAKVLRAEKELGSVEPGKLADLVAFRRNPLDDVSVLATAPELVMKGGVVVAGGGTGGKGTAR